MQPQERIDIEIAGRLLCHRQSRAGIGSVTRDDSARRSAPPAEDEAEPSSRTVVEAPAESTWMSGLARAMGVA